jgi:hypothetical protein
MTDIIDENDHGINRQQCPLSNLRAILIPGNNQDESVDTWKILRG